MGSSKISIKTNHGIEIIKLKDIVCCIAHGRYSKIITIDGKEYFLTRLLKDLENSLSKEYFFRSHKSFLINLNHIKTYSEIKTVQLLSLRELRLNWQKEE